MSTHNICLRWFIGKLGTCELLLIGAMGLIPVCVCKVLGYIFQKKHIYNCSTMVQNLQLQ